MPKLIKQGLTALLLAVLPVLPAHAGVCATDDTGQQVCLPAPAQRIAGLSPGASELLWSAGAGDQVVAVVAWSDYPPEAKTVASVGSHTRLDLEKLISLQPDLVIAWVTGNPQEQIQTIRNLGLPVFSIEPRDFEDVSSVIERLATLAGTEAEGWAEAERFRTGMAELAARYSDRAPVPVFYQVWDEPLMTVNNQHLIGKVIALCGGYNVFGELPRLVPRISDEAVLEANPEAILAGGMGEENRAWLDRWQNYSSLDATRVGNLFFVPPSLIQRPTPRMLQGSELFCQKLEIARGRR
ncbi:cobalamin-binding protein [Marinobacter mobilis]|uniref:Iron complex transport system substrate-binding protein n=1 Tax=Marinobacter mobilis TaxID=488533 RepID=A0A1H2Y6H9_9GAMM|nr:cobalamin-binding protein [Marinobacter mobilis]SDX00595.1 iron complex transport system substrate-binding protein [Marinobacter mobilis]SDX48568.1 iron complex transport system substrate-binding protein [Marinobacter mobilis]